MVDNNTKTKDYLRKATSAEVKVRAAKLGLSKIRLFDLLAVLPYKELKVLVEKHLTKKQPPSH